MAVENLVPVSGFCTASASLTAKQYNFVAISGNRTVAAAGAGARALGVLQNAPDTSQAATIAHCGSGIVSKLLLGGTVVAGNHLKSDANGAAVATGAGTDYALATALEGGVSGNYITAVLAVTPVDGGYGT